MDETQGSTPVETTQTQVETTTPQTPAVENVQAAVAGTEGTDTPVTPPGYTPNYKFKAMGKEHEFDEFVRGAIKDQEHEAKLRSIYEKAHGLDFMKGRFNETREHLRTRETELGSITNELKEVGSYISKKDYGSFLKKFNIPENDMLEWAVQYAQRKQLPPEQQQVYDAQDAAQTQLRDVQKQNEWLQEQYRSQMAQIRQSELNQALADQSISEFTNSYDERVGQQGAFQMEVVRRGALHYQMTGQDLPPAEVVKQTLFALGWQGQTQQGTQQPSNVTRMPTQGMVNGKPPVIPNVSGKSVSPVKKAPKSLDDLRNLSKSMA